METRYYILSRRITVQEFAEAVRGHWGIENNLHWQLDVSFREDECRVCRDHAPANLSVIRRFALGLLKRETSCRKGIDIKRMNARGMTNTARKYYSIVELKMRWPWMAGQELRIVSPELQELRIVSPELPRITGQPPRLRRPAWLGVPSPEASGQSFFAASSGTVTFSASRGCRITARRRVFALALGFLVTRWTHPDGS